MRSIRSFAKARSRLSANHRKILNQENDFFFSANTKPAFEETLRCTNNKILEIGFGEGDSLFEMAVNNPDLNFFGIEVYETGVARTCSKIEESGIKNLKIYLGDVVDLILDKDIETTFDLLLFLFPDPWHKRKHNKRRLISENFLMNIKKIMRENGTLRIKTDWQDYADEIEIYLKKVFKNYKEAADQKLDSITKYEKIALAEKRKISYFEVY